MNCDRTRHHWNLYHDSEGDPETCFEINEHLDRCPECAAWFQQQSRLEEAVAAKLRESAGPSSELWTRILAQSGLEPQPARARGWPFLGSLLTLAATLAIAVASWWGLPGAESADLPRLAADYHQQFSLGTKAVAFASESDLEVDRYLRQQASFAVRCPPRQDSGFRVRGAGVCRDPGWELVYLVGQVDNQPVSIFILARENLPRFPRQQAAVHQEGTHRCREGPFQVVMAEIDQSVVVVIGQANGQRLERVLRGYGTYRDPQHG